MSIFAGYPKPDLRRAGMKDDYLIIHAGVPRPRPHRPHLPLYGAVKISR